MFCLSNSLNIGENLIISGRVPSIAAIFIPITLAIDWGMFFSPDNILIISQHSFLQNIKLSKPDFEHVNHHAQTMFYSVHTVTVNVISAGDRSFVKKATGFFHMN